MEGGRPFRSSFGRSTHMGTAYAMSYTLASNHSEPSVPASTAQHADVLFTQSSLTNNLTPPVDGVPNSAVIVEDLRILADKITSLFSDFEAQCDKLDETLYYLKNRCTKGPGGGQQFQPEEAPLFGPDPPLMEMDVDVEKKPLLLFQSSNIIKVTLAMGREREFWGKK